MYLWSILMCPVTCYQYLSLQIPWKLYNAMKSLQPIFSKASSPKLAATHGTFLPALPAFLSFSGYTFTSFSTLWSPELHTVRPHQCWIQWDNDHDFWSPVFDVPKDGVCPLGCPGSLLAPADPTVNHHTQILFWGSQYLRLIRKMEW